ncbi:MAG: hypothetical protein Q9227_006449 [Pyrenula ochraceoflavens]
MGPKRKTSKPLSPAAVRNHDNKTSPDPGIDHLPLELQQQLLSIFKTALPLSRIPDLQSTVQKVKGHLYNRDFDAAFGQEDYLEAYAIRWSPSRALAYSEIFSCAALRSLLWNRHKHEHDPPKVVLVGGGAGAELVALAGLIRLGVLEKMSIAAVDIADWSSVLDKLHHAIVTGSPAAAAAVGSVPKPDSTASEPATTNKTVSPTKPSGITESSSVAAGSSLPNPHFPVVNPAPSAIAQNIPPPTGILPISPESIHLTFHHHNILHLPTSTSPLLSLLLPTTHLLTLHFTLSELLSTSLPLTTSFLLSLSDHLPLNSFLLIVDSPGSYSAVALNPRRNKDADADAEAERGVGGGRKYPMDWLLDHTLLELTKTAGEGGGAKGKGKGKWEKLIGIGSRWFRVSEELQRGYPLQLENMRYQMHLYRRV